MLVFKSAELRGFSISEDLQGTRSNKVILDFEVENVGKAIAHNPSLQYDLEVQPDDGVGRVLSQKMERLRGTIKFTDDPPATPVVGEGEVEVPYKVLVAFLRPRVKARRTFLDIFTLHYRLSYDDEATGAHFVEKESCGEFLVETLQMRGSAPLFSMQPCTPK
jgi:hypothetical protein